VSGLRLYVHDRHGRHVNGDERVQRARTFHTCGAYVCPNRVIAPGDWYSVATLYPSDEDFHYLDRYTLEPSTTAVRMKVCIRCMHDDKRDLIAAIEMEMVHA